MLFIIATTQGRAAAPGSSSCFHMGEDRGVFSVQQNFFFFQKYHHPNFCLMMQRKRKTWVGEIP
jgi:hypothetical protein